MYVCMCVHLCARSAGRKKARFSSPRVFFFGAAGTTVLSLEVVCAPLRALNYLVVLTVCAIAEMSEALLLFSMARTRFKQWHYSVVFAMCAVLGSWRGKDAPKCRGGRLLRQRRGRTLLDTFLRASI